MEEKEIVVRCLQGNVEDFKIIVDKYRAQAMALAMNILKEFLVLITPFKDDEFRIEFFEQNQAQKTSLLDTKINLPYKNIAVFGFEDKQGKPYFLSFHVSDRLITDVMSPEIEEVFATGAVRARGEIKPPRLIKSVDPIYPKEARKNQVEGLVIL